MSKCVHTISITAIIENNGQFLFVKRSKHEANMAGKWVFPGGKIEKGEDAIQALFRELSEETGLSFSDEVAFLSSYYFLRHEDESSSIGLVFLVRALNRDVVIDDSIETFDWIYPEQISDFTFSYKDIVDFEREKKVTIPGMEVHVRNAIIAMKKNLFLDRHLLSVTEYQQNGGSMTRDYLNGLMNADNIDSYLKNHNNA